MLEPAIRLPEQAQRHGRIVGLPNDFAKEVAALADALDVSRLR
jgi:hypothetical protein